MVPGVVDVYPVNRTRVHSANAVCTDDLLFLRHLLLVRASAPGTLHLRFHGAQRGGDTGSTTGPAVLERTVSVQ